MRVMPGIEWECRESAWICGKSEWKYGKCAESVQRYRESRWKPRYSGRNDIEQQGK